MFYSISLYSALAIFSIGLLYKISTWLSLKMSVESKSASTRFSAALKGIISTMFSGRILTLLKAFFLDVIVQKKLLTEDFFRWLTHVLIYWAFMLLLLMHALDTLITSNIFPDYAPTLNPFMFLRDLFGLLVIVGICMAIYRRFIRKAPRLTTNGMDHYAIILLAIIMLSGVLLEGAKIGSYSVYTDMVEEYAGIDDEEEMRPLTAFWVKYYGVVSPDVKGPFEDELLAEGKELHEMSCAGCHSRPQWAFMGNSVAASVRGIALGLNNAGIHTLLWYIHFLACFIGLAYLPFSKFFHIFTSPVSILANSVMNREDSERANIETRQALELDACTHCGQCTSRCSAGAVFESTHNINVLPSEKLQSLKKIVSEKETDKQDFMLVLDGVYLCTNCRRCTDICPAGINLEDLWFTMREEMFQKDYPEFSVLSPLSFYRGLMRENIPEDEYKKPLNAARQAIADQCSLIQDQGKTISLSAPDQEFKLESLSDQAATFHQCFGCQTCTNVCPVVANYENPKEVLGLLPHQIMYSLGLGIKELALGSNMLWDCTTCYQCQEQCPQGVKVTEVLFELKNLAVQNVTNTNIVTSVKPV